MKASEAVEVEITAQMYQEEPIVSSCRGRTSGTDTREREHTASAPETHRPGADMPDLRVLSRDELLLQEEVDSGRASRLTERLSADGVLKNPPIVASLDGGRRYLLLDGANRVAALDSLGVPCLFVQVEDYEDPDLVLSHWNHVVWNIDAETLLEEVYRIHGITIEEGLSVDDAVVGDPRYLCTIALHEMLVFHLYGGQAREERVRLLKEITRIYYRGPAQMDRVNHADIGAVRRQRPGFTALILFPDFSKAEVRETVESGCRLPAGLTRFMVPRRALGFHLPLSFLSSELPLAEKQNRLKEVISDKLAERKVRFYGEPTFFFDE